MENQKALTYSDAGVDIDFAGNCLLEMEKTRSRSKEVIKSPNDFAGMFSLKDLCARFDDPVLVASTDGVGTKLLAAIICQEFSGLGQDLVAMCANDIITKGAEPLFFLDYFAAANLRNVPFLKVMNGIVTACDEIDCALLGGETAEMPAMYAHKHFDLAGFIVGAVDRKNMLGAHRVKEGDVIIGITSSGLHANGFSLVRKIMFDKLGHKSNDVLWETERTVRTVADELLLPTKLYVNPIKALFAEKIDVHALAHITGGGLIENVPRVLPGDLAANISIDITKIPRIFTYLMEKGPVSFDEMVRTFNMGIGMVLIVPKSAAEDALHVLKLAQETARIIGEIVPSDGSARCQVKT